MPNMTDIKMEVVGTTFDWLEWTHLGQDRSSFFPFFPRGAAAQCGPPHA